MRRKEKGLFQIQGDYLTYNKSRCLTLKTQPRILVWVDDISSLTAGTQRKMLVVAMQLQI